MTMMMSAEDESILKTALAFVVLRRRVQARKNDENDENGKCSTNNSSCQNEEETDIIPVHELNANSNNFNSCNTTTNHTTIDVTANKEVNASKIRNNSNQIPTKNKTLPFLNGINLQASSRRDPGDPTTCTPTSISTATACTMNSKHIESMLQVAHSTSMNLYSNIICHERKDTCTTTTTSNSANKCNTNVDSLKHGTHPAEISTSSKPSSSPSINSTTSFCSLIYDFETASLTKITTTSSNTKSTRSTSSVKMTSPSSSKNNYSSYAVLDGILFHLTSQLRNAHTSSSSSSSSSTRSNKDVYTFIFKQLLHPILVSSEELSLSPRREKNSESSTTSSRTDYNCHHHSKSSIIIKNVQNILSTCTILHRLCLFDNSLSSHVVIGLCHILKCLYYHECQGDVDNDDGNVVVQILLSIVQKQQLQYKQYKQEMFDGNGNNDDGRSSRMRKNNENGSSSRSRRRTRDERLHRNTKTYDHDQYKCIQIEDVIAVNCLILLEQVIGMSLRGTRSDTITSNSTTTAAAAAAAAATTGGRRGANNPILTYEESIKQKQKIDHLMSLLSIHLGPELMIPVSTNDMALFHVCHGRKVKNRQWKNSREGNVMSTRQSDGIKLTDDDGDAVVFRKGLNAGAKMMLRLNVYDIVQKLTYRSAMLQ